MDFFLGILGSIFLLFVLVGILGVIFEGDPHEKVRKARAEVDRLNAENEDEIAKAQANIKELATSSLERDFEEGETKSLNILDLVSLAVLPFGDMLDATKKADPLIPLSIIYCWLEQLSENYVWPGEYDEEEYPEETSSLTKFIWNFLKSELTDEEWKATFDLYFDAENDDVSSHGFFDELAGFRFVRDRIVRAFEDSSIEEKSNMCAVFSSELIEYIDDEALKERFVVLASSSLNDAGLMSSSAESTLASLDL